MIELDKLPGKVLLMTDTHLVLETKNKVNSIFDQAIEICKKYEIKVVFHLGDFFTERDSLRLDILLVGQKLIQKFKDNGIAFYIIPGNHDKPNYDSEESYLDLFTLSINLIRDYQISNQGKFSFLPFFSDKVYSEKLINLCEQLEKYPKGPRFLFTHIGIEGFLTNNGREVNGINKLLFNSFDRVFVGHYHNRKEIGNITYMGSTYQANYGEDMNKGFVIFNTFSGEYEYIVSDFETYFKYEVDYEEFKYILIPFQSCTYNKIVIYGKSSDIIKIDKEQLRSLGWDEIEIRLKTSNKGENVSVSFREVQSNLSGRFKDYCKLEQVSPLVELNIIKKLNNVDSQ